MAYVQIPKDLSRVKTKVLFNLTRRQLICFLLAGIIGISVYLLTRKIMGNTLSAMVMIVLILPFFLLAMYEKDGRPLEKVIRDIIQSRFIRPKVRVYRTENVYRIMQDRIYEREVLGIGKTESKGKRTVATGGPAKRNCPDGGAEEKDHQGSGKKEKGR